MAKYVNQDVFDGSIALLASAKINSDAEYKTTLSALVNYYKNDYVGDYVFQAHLEEGASKLLEKFKHIPNHRLKGALEMAAQMRSHYDDNMQKKGALKKLFGGTSFTSGHPNPNVRLNNGLANMSSLIDTVLIYS